MFTYKPVRDSLAQIITLYGSKCVIRVISVLRLLLVQENETILFAYRRRRNFFSSLKRNMHFMYSNILIKVSITDF